MSRSGYHDDLDHWDMIRWRGAVKSAMRGKRGQSFLKELLASLDAMPEKRLVGDSFQSSEGEFCTLGVLGNARGTKMDDLIVDDGYGYFETDSDLAAERFGVAQAMLREIMFENDEAGPYLGETPEQRWQRMRTWVAAQIKEPAT